MLPLLSPDHQKLEREARICRLLKHSNIGKHFPWFEGVPSLEVGLGGWKIRACINFLEQLWVRSARREYLSIPDICLSRETEKAFVQNLFTQISVCWWTCACNLLLDVNGGYCSKVHKFALVKPQIRCWNCCESVASNDLFVLSNQMASGQVIKWQEHPPTLPSSHSPPPLCAVAIQIDVFLLSFFYMNHGMVLYDLNVLRSVSRGRFDMVMATFAKYPRIYHGIYHVLANKFSRTGVLFKKMSH